MMESASTATKLASMLAEAHALKSPPLIMGILNVTPDSFSDGNRYLAPEAALARAAEMIHAGAAIIDIGPESTRPGSEPVPPAEQLRRCLPAMHAIHAAFPEAPISIDTRSAAVAAAAIEAGAVMINDISALRDDPEMAPLAARHRVVVALMHMKGVPQTMQSGGGPAYHDVVREIMDFLQQRIAFATAAGIDPPNIVVDPGIGFGKTVDQNVEIIRRLAEFRDLGRPLLFGASRKGFIGTITGAAQAKDRLAGSLACLSAAVSAGTAILRVHDVAESKQAARLAWRIGRG